LLAASLLLAISLNATLFLEISELAILRDEHIVGAGHDLIANAVCSWTLYV